MSKRFRMVKINTKRLFGIKANNRYIRMKIHEVEIIRKQYRRGSNYTYG